MDLRPGTTLSTTISTSDLGLGAPIRTITCADGDNMWDFSHPLEGLGLRARCFLTDAYMYAMIQEPGRFPEFSAISLRLASTTVTCSAGSPAAR